MITGGVGLLAGFHGSGTVEGFCLSCSHKWDVKKLVEQRNREESIRRIQEHGEWKKEFYLAYNDGHFDLASQIYISKFPFDKETPDVHAGFKRQKKIEREMKILVGVIVGIACAVVRVLVVAN
ncbi:MAG: hypothetical protein WKF91_16280 [Segetibacter sp.]